MPEGDTVWLTARRLDRALAGRELVIGELRVPELATTDLRGRTVTEVLARGKHLLTRLDDRRTLHSHLRMDGSWYLSRAGVAPRGHPAHMIRARLGNSEWLATGYRVHDLRLTATADEARVVGHLGPDLLGPDWDPEEALRRLREHPDRTIKEALLDQTRLAGVGNMYACELCFISGVDPRTPVASVPDLPRMVARAHQLLDVNRRRAMQSTTGDLTPRRNLWVYARGGLPCRRCGTRIVETELGDAGRERVTYFCPRCQS
jgi:formamidopyrimidine-DNA glycosylase